MDNMTWSFNGLEHLYVYHIQRNCVYSLDAGVAKIFPPYSMSCEVDMWQLRWVFFRNICFQLVYDTLQYSLLLWQVWSYSSEWFKSGFEEPNIFLLKMWFWVWNSFIRQLYGEFKIVLNKLHYKSSTKERISSSMTDKLIFEAGWS